MAMIDDGRVLAAAAVGALALGAAASSGSRSVSVEALAAACAPEAFPGLQADLGPGEIVVYRTSRQRAESEAVCEALGRGEPGEAFRASTRIHPQLTGHGRSYERRLQRALARGGRPLFTTPYPSTAYFYRSFAASDPVTWALVVPESAVIWTNSRTYRTGGIFYSLTYPDAEVVIDARAVRRVLHVPAVLIDALGAAVESLADANIVRGAFRAAFLDRDPDLAAAARKAVVDLRLPPTALGRPFLEAPLPTPVGQVQKGDRVLLRDGQVVKLKGHRRVGGEAEVRRVFWRDQEDSFQVSGLTEWMASYAHLDGMNMTPDWFERVVEPRERVTRQERVATWHRHRGFISRLLDYEEARLLEGLERRGPDPRIEQALGWIERDRALLAGAEPPWLDKRAAERAVKELRYG